MLDVLHDPRVTPQTNAYWNAGKGAAAKGPGA